jgi:hypothetical protein
MRGDRLMAINVSGMNLITFAYDLHEQQVSGGPSLDVGGQVRDRGQTGHTRSASIRQMKLLLQKALVDRSSSNSIATSVS